MKIHEYQAKEILDKGGIPVPKGVVARAPEEAAAVSDLGGSVVVKAQVHGGGQGKAGGIKLVATPEEASAAASELIGSNLVTHQTGPEGVPIRSVLVEEALEVDRELYVGMVIDGSAGGVVVMASEAGGMDIEEVAEQAPEKTVRIAIDPVLVVGPSGAADRGDECAPHHLPVHETRPARPTPQPIRSPTRSPCWRLSPRLRCEGSSPPGHARVSACDGP